MEHPLGLLNQATVELLYFMQESLDLLYKLGAYGEEDMLNYTEWSHV